jgi:hypothetical protein
VCWSATARKISAFSSARIRRDIRLLSSTASLGMLSGRLVPVRIQIVHRNPLRGNQSIAAVES